MHKNKIYKLSLLIIAITYSATLPTQDVAAYQFSNQANNWFLIDERITDRPPNFLAKILFADKASINGPKNNLNISVSDIAMREDKIDGILELRIVDSRMQMTINCNQKLYKVAKSVEFDQDNIEIEGSRTEQETQWIAPNEESYVQLLSFACDANANRFEQPFGGAIQPLVGLITYLNADWSK